MCLYAMDTADLFERVRFFNDPRHQYPSQGETGFCYGENSLQFNNYINV